MQLTQEAIEEFKAIYKKEFDEDITDAEAREMETRLLRVFRILLDVNPGKIGNESQSHLHPDQHKFPNSPS